MVLEAAPAGAFLGGRSRALTRGPAATPTTLHGYSLPSCSPIAYPGIEPRRNAVTVDVDRKKRVGRMEAYLPECVEGLFSELHFQHRVYCQSNSSANCPIAAVLLIGLHTVSCDATYTYILMTKLGVSIPFDRPPHPPASSLRLSTCRGCICFVRVTCVMGQRSHYRGHLATFYAGSWM